MSQNIDSIKQLPLGIVFNPAYRMEDFYPSKKVMPILKLFNDVSLWKSHCLIIYGSSGAGKTHLCHIFKEILINNKVSDNVLIEEGSSLNSLHIADMVKAAKYIALDNIENIEDETTLLHLFNFSKENGGKLLLTSQCPPNRLHFKLPDLTSRIMTATALEIPEPDDETITAVIVKLFADRQMSISEEALSYLLPRIERSFKTIRILVEKADTLSLSEKKGITVPLLKKVID